MTRKRTLNSCVYGLICCALFQGCGEEGVHDRSSDPWSTDSSDRVVFLKESAEQSLPDIERCNDGDRHLVFSFNEFPSDWSDVPYEPEGDYLFEPVISPTTRYAFECSSSNEPRTYRFLGGRLFCNGSVVISFENDPSWLEHWLGGQFSFQLGNETEKTMYRIPLSWEQTDRCVTSIFEYQYLEREI